MKLGEFLKQERLKRGITLEEIAEATKVRSQILQSIEENKYADLPPPPFIRGFVISYCKYVGLNQDEVLAKFKQQFEKKVDDELLSNSSSPLGGLTYEKAKLEGFRSLRLLWLSIIALGGVAAVYLILYYGLRPALLTRNHPPPTSTQQPQANAPASPPLEQQPRTVPLIEQTPEIPPGETKTTADSGKREAEPENKPSPNPVTAESPESDLQFESVEPNRKPREKDPLHKGDDLPPAQIRFKLVFKVSRDVTIRYKVDDRPRMSYKLPKDKIIVFRALKWIIYEVTDAEAVMFRIDNEKKYKPLETKTDLIKKGDKTLGAHPAQARQYITTIFPNS